jgi:hypothetical protein
MGCCKSIADILRGLGEVPPSDISRTSETPDQPIEIAEDPPVRVVRGYGERSTAQTARNRERSCERSRVKRALARLAEPPVPSEIMASVAGEPWLRLRIDASLAKDVIERHDDDRSREWRRRQYEATLGAIKPTSRPKFNFGAKVKAKPAPKPKAKRERTDATRAYFREYGRMWRARKKAETHAH